MVCQLDVEAKRRKMAELEAARDAAGVAATHIDTASAEDIEKRRIDREAKLRERAMKPMPAAMSASSVYDDDEPGQSSLRVEKQKEADTNELAAAASGVDAPMHKGMQVRRRNVGECHVDGGVAPRGRGWCHVHGGCAVYGRHVAARSF